MRIVPAYAKLNLGLAVLGRRPDGFHDIDSLVVRIDWHDLVGVEPAAGHSLAVTGIAGAPAGDDNLASRAARAVERSGGPPLRVWLHKRIPAQAGLGGGSADAAAVLRAARSETGAEVPPETMLELGSDVPSLCGPLPARIGGRGEETAPVAIPRLHAVVVIAGTGETGAAYTAVSAADCESAGRISALLAAIATGTGADEVMGSGLERAACSASPELAAAAARLRNECPAHRWHLTGSGGALFTLVPGTAEAGALTARLRTSGWQARSCHTLAE